MADETLLSAARRVVRFFQIDMNAGGLITNDTEIAMLTLEKMVRIEMERDNGQNLPRPDPTIRLPE
jgi:hypothetical protein